MNRFSIARPKDFQQAAGLLTDARFKLPMLKAGGVDVLDHLKEGLAEPDLLVSIGGIRNDGGAGPISRMDNYGGRGIVGIEANATLAEIAASALVRAVSPVVAQAVELAATPQVRNMATAAGNLLQRPRCWYYRNEQFNCLKKGGSTCFAVEGENRYHAVFGPGPCHIVHPSNLAPALIVCGGGVRVIGGKRSHVGFDELYHTPEKGVTGEHNLEKGEVVTHIEVEVSPTSGFYAVKEKQSFDWPLAMAAVAVELKGEVIQTARVCLGAVAPIPWRLPKVEEALLGVRIDDETAVRKAAALATEGASPMSDNAYKLKLLPVVVRRALMRAVGRKAEALP